MMQKYSLNGKWDLYFFAQENSELKDFIDYEKNSANKIIADVPGNVELDLSEAGILPKDLFWGSNILELKNYENYEWWYEKEFDLPETINRKSVSIRFEGVDCLAEYWLNGEKIGSSENMFIPVEFDITNKLIYGKKNKITVRIRSIMREAYKDKRSMFSIAGGKGVKVEAMTIRKAPHSFGWDIMPRALTSGIWRDVNLVVREEYEIEQLFYFCNYLSEKRSVLCFCYELDAYECENMYIEIEGKCGESGFYHKENMTFKSGKVWVHVKKPQMWWPYGYGAPALYDTTVRFYKDDKVVSEERLNVGIRTVELRRTDITDGKDGEFCFYINNVPVMCKGTNWVPLDAFHSRDKGRYKEALEMVKDIECNIIRCWGGNVYEEKEFFDFCDENGIMVWQDFAMACNAYPQSQEFLEKIYNEASEIIKLHRNHPSIVLWSGDNECDTNLSVAGINPADNKVTRVALKNAVVDNDVGRPYLPSSPYMSGEVFEKKAKEYMSEDHLWGPRDYYKSSYYTTSKAHFVSEIGCHGCPSRKSIEKFIDKEALWPIYDNKQWNLHTTPMCMGEHDMRVVLMADQVKQLFGELPDNLDDFAFASQISQAESKKFFIEHTRLNRDVKRGIIWWNLLDGWPQMSDAIVDYYFEKKIAYDYIKRSQQPFTIMCSELKNWGTTVVASNDSLNTVCGNYRVTDVMSDKVVLEGDFSVEKNSNYELGFVRLMFSVQGMYLIEWWIDGRRYINHYTYGMPKFELEEYRKWFEKIK